MKQWLLFVFVFFLHKGTSGNPLQTSALLVSDPEEPRDLLHHGWKACRWEIARQQEPVGCPGNNETATWNVSTLPTTALAVFLEHQQIPGLEEHAKTINDLYHSHELFAKVPDIAHVGRSFYTLAYEIALNFGEQDHDVVLHIAGVNYRTHAYWNGRPLLEEVSRRHVVDGMFQRRLYHLPRGKGRFVLVVEPPLHPGWPQTAIANQGHETSETLHQPQRILFNNNQHHHDLAMDGPTAQFMSGWDWCQAMPDRATGFYGSVRLERLGRRRQDSVKMMLLDPAIHTVKLMCDTAVNASSSACSHVVLAISVRILCLNNNDNNDTDDPTSDACHDNTFYHLKLVVTSDWGEVWEIPLSLARKTKHNERHIVHHRVPITQQVHLWWPRGMGVQPVAHLHTFTFALQDHADKQEPFATTTLRAGIRTISTYLDPKTQGQRFVVNGQHVYLVGGNWITTDQALRYSASSERYCHELKLHAHAGLNLIRVWGGGVTETEAFYECADRIGLLVYQEFWMTGDGNGRWAGKYSWPLDYDTYLANVRDVVLRLRRHASLLFYAGCNECLAPRDVDPQYFPNPPRAIDDGIRRLLEEYDPGRFYISSSMGGTNVADRFEDPSLWANRSYSLAYADGPYGMLLPADMFQRNPGLQNLVPPSKNVSIGFQPEIGSTSAPTYNGFLRFMTQHDLDHGFPLRGADSGRRQAWEFHRYQPWLTPIDDDKDDNNNTHYYDHVYSYFSPNHTVTAEDWVAVAQLAAHSQYQHLMNAFVSRMSDYTTAVILWKTQSPWPALRGFLYDWYLETTGSLRGVRAALQSSVSIVLDMSTWRLRIVNRCIFMWSSQRENRMGARYQWIDTSGTTVSSGVVLLSSNQSIVPAMSAAVLGTKRMQWPASCSRACFLWLQPILPQSRNKVSNTSSWYWLTNPALGNQSDFSLLGDMRRGQRLIKDGVVTLAEVSCETSKTGGTVVHATICIHKAATEVLFYPTFSLAVETTGESVLPLFDRMETNVVLRPGHNETRHLETTHSFPAATWVQVTLHSWNGPTISRDVVC